MVRSQRPQSNQSGGSPGALFVYLAGAGIARMALLARFNTTLARMGSNRQRALDTRVSSRDPVSLNDRRRRGRAPAPTHVQQHHPSVREIARQVGAVRRGRWSSGDATPHGHGAGVPELRKATFKVCCAWHQAVGVLPASQRYHSLVRPGPSTSNPFRPPTIVAAVSCPFCDPRPFRAGCSSASSRSSRQLRGVRLRPPPEQCLHIQLQRDRTPWGSPLRAESAAAAHARRSAHYTQRESVPQRDLFSERERGDQRVSLPRPADCTLKATRSHTTCRVALPGTAGALTHDGKPGVSEVARGRINGAAAARDTNSELLPLARPGHMCLPIPISQSTYVASRITIVCRSSSRTGHKYNSRKSCR